MFRYCFINNKFSEYVVLKNGRLFFILKKNNSYIERLEMKELSEYGFDAGTLFYCLSKRLCFLFHKLRRIGKSMTSIVPVMGY